MTEKELTSILFKEILFSVGRVEKKVDGLFKTVATVDRTVAVVKTDLKNHIDTTKPPRRISAAPRVVRESLLKNIPPMVIIRSLMYLIIAAGMAAGFFLFK